MIKALRSIQGVQIFHDRPEGLSVIGQSESPVEVALEGLRVEVGHDTLLAAPYGRTVIERRGRGPPRDMLSARAWEIAWIRLTPSGSASPAEYLSWQRPRNCGTPSPPAADRLHR